MKHICIEARVYNHPQMKAAGNAAGDLYLHLLRLSRDTVRSIFFDAAHAEPGWLAQTWGLCPEDMDEFGGGSPEDYVAHALKRLHEVGAVQADRHGGFALMGLPPLAEEGQP